MHRDLFLMPIMYASCLHDFFRQPSHTSLPQIHADRSFKHGLFKEICLSASCRYEDRGNGLNNRRMEIIGASVVNGFGDLGQSLGCDPAFRVSLGDAAARRAPHLELGSLTNDAREMQECFISRGTHPVMCYAQHPNRSP